VILATLAQVSKNVSLRFSESRDPSSLECCPNPANPSEQSGARPLFSFGGVLEELLQLSTMQIKSLHHQTMQFNTTANHGQTLSATPLSLKLQGGRTGAQETEHQVTRN